MNGKISIVVPIYNAQDYLELCIESLINQTYENIEIILVNDGSKDNSLSICKAYAEKDDRIVVIDKKNTGVSDTRNTGIKAATGDFIMFCDSDDCAAKTLCSDMISEYSEDYLTMCDFLEVQNENIENIYKKGIHKKSVEVEFLDKKDFLFYRSFGLGLPSAKIFNAQIIKDNKLLFPVEISLGEDLAFVLSYLNVIGKGIKYYKKELYLYRQTGNDSLSQKAPSFEQIEYFYKMLVTYMNKFNAKSMEAIEELSKVIMYDYEKAFRAILRNNNINLINKYKTVCNVMKSKSYKKCCINGKITTNKIYQFILKNRCAALLILFLMVTA